MLAVAVVNPAFFAGALSVFAKFSPKIHLPIFSSRSSGWARVDKKHEIYVDALQWRIQDFPRGGGAPTPKLGVLIYYFCRKLHENERIWTPRGGARPWRPPWIRQCLVPKYKRWLPVG